MKPGLGTQLRHLIELLDGDVAQTYADAGLDYRPRFTPVMRVLQEHGTAFIGQIAEACDITQPAVTQTVSLMKKKGLVDVSMGADGRQRLVSLTPHGSAVLVDVAACWVATTAAADHLDAELLVPLSSCLAEAISALKSRSFAARIRDARAAGAVPMKSEPTASSAVAVPTKSSKNKGRKE
ncbi:MAG: MarR family winged helix-turn-helix transcriptional regulator [Luteimonas sp.]